jgi:uracil-DNA glycosylase family 4
MMPINPFDWVFDEPFVSVWELAVRGRPGPGVDFSRQADSELGLADLRMKLKLKDYDGASTREEVKAKIAEIKEKIAELEPRHHRLVDYEYRRALYDPRYTLSVANKGRIHADVPFMRGGIWGMPAFGPDEFAVSDVMIIGKHPGHVEMTTGLNFQGPTSGDLVRACRKCGIEPAEFLSWYATNVVKFNRPDGDAGELPKSWVADCLPLLWQELIIVRPKFILCLGGDAIKALMGSSYNVSNMAGRMVPFTYKAARRGSKPSTYAELEEHTAIVMCAPHPSYVFHKPAAFDDLQLSVQQFWELSRGRIEASDEEGDVRHMAVYTESVLAGIVDAIRARPGDLTVAFDAEWHGRNWNEEGSYLRTIQFSPAWKESYCVVLNDVGGVPAFRPGQSAAIAQLRRLVADKPDGIVRVGGHAFRADMPWLMAAGLDLMPFFDIPEGWDPRVMPRGLDTLYLAHATHEDAETFKLENLAMRYTSCPRWDVKLQQWKDGYCKENNLKDKDLEGYGMCPGDILYPYGNYDADSTRRLIDVFWGHCVADIHRVDPITRHGLDSRAAYLNSMQAWAGFLEMEMTGVEVDLPRAESLIRLFSSKAERLVAHLQSVLSWPKFNPRSAPMCRELLFGHGLNGTVDKATGEPRVLRPAGAMEPFYLTPIKTTSKPPKPWDQVVFAGEAHKFTPGTDKETLGILAHDNDVVKLLRDIRFVGQVGITVLRPPKPPKAKGKVGGKAERAVIEARLDRPWAKARSEDAAVARVATRAGRAIELDDDTPELSEADVDEGWGDDAVYDGGFVYYMDGDGRVRSHFYAAETGRCTSSRPNLQNLAKQRDADYQRILGHSFVDKKGKYVEVAPYKDVLGGLFYQDPIRTICRASPGTVLIEFDLKSAEIAMLAWEADDDVMIEDVRRNMLDEEDPSYVDLHAATAIAAFHLDCPPTKAGLEMLGLSHIRTPAKNVRFGVPYGRSAPAIARQCQEQGAPVSVADAQRLIDGWHSRYPSSSRFLTRCERRPHEPGWMSGPFRRFRRFSPTADRKIMADMERQAKNFCIQNGVADAISLAIYNLVKYRDANRSEGSFRIILQIHDALLLEVPVEHVPWVYDHVLPRCVVDGVGVTPLDLDGRDNILKGRPPYHFGIDKELYVNWGEKLDWGQSRDDLIRGGLDPRYLPREKPPQKVA